MLNNSSYEKLLHEDSSISMHHRRVVVVVIEMLRVHMGGAPNIVNEVFLLNSSSSCNLRNQQIFAIRPLNTVYYG